MLGRSLRPRLDQKGLLKNPDAQNLEELGGLAFFAYKTMRTTERNFHEAGDRQVSQAFCRS